MDITALVNQLEQLLRIAITIISAYFIALWIACVWWTFRDIRARTTDIFLQIAATLLVAVFSLPGLLIYVVLRPPKTLAQLYEDSLEEEAFLQGIQVHNSCPVCKQRVEPEFIFCPWCQTRLKRTCTRCERPLVLRWKMCPYCGTNVYTTPLPDEVGTAVATLPEPADEGERDLVESRGKGGRRPIPTRN
ncbi:MAG: zinc ribbon domain-containing protein [Chloroflexota bacterium]|nr:zinc ribbon domain-containing protein [Chloroflexota bacterium]MDQ6863397.1 zinc ribbon domain-containing protein [Thermoproteota archaeon]